MESIKYIFSYQERNVGNVRRGQDRMRYVEKTPNRKKNCQGRRDIAKKPETGSSIFVKQGLISYKRRSSKMVCRSQ